MSVPEALTFIAETHPSVKEAFTLRFNERRGSDEK
jgi:hypothetical protein